jgi:hypothetical protein
MPPLGSTRASPALAEGGRDRLHRALGVLSQLTGAVVPLNPPMPISTFKARYGAVLRQADHDGLALISQGSKRYVIVGEQHMAALSGNEPGTRSVADICMALPRPSRAVDLSPAQMTGMQADIAVPSRRHG